MKKKAHIIKRIEEGSIAKEMELSPGDELLMINNKQIIDILDYHYLIKDEYLDVLIKKTSGEEWELKIEKNYDEDLGITFEKGLMDEYRSCQNKCIFCFIDQLPPGMRKTLYFKDDDARLSFLQGNYITLTNLSEDEIDRILFYKLSPINISIHTTNKELRCKMLNNRFAGNALEKIKRLKEGNITMNGQIVLCKGYNDGDELERTIHDLSAFLPQMQSVSIVPVGLTKYRDNLIHLKKFTKDDSIKVLEIIHKWQSIFLKHYSTRFIYGSDEWYLTADLPILDAKSYEGYPQIENGVGMLRSFIDEYNKSLINVSGDNKNRSFSIATGELATPYIIQAVNKFKEKFVNTKIKIYTIKNNFFGTDITVTGLITGSDIIIQLMDKPLGDYLMLPNVMLRNGETIFLDDITVEELERTLQTRIRIVQSDGKSFLESIINE